ncbi:MAG TPA: hypothetical protein VGP68_11215 [Gemmataceae bacterium]|jgi:hypothetical protein|nr:hypothetical protein [Gemmataceae bacterium]
MSTDQTPSSNENKLRRAITGCLVFLAVICVGWIATLRLSPERATHHGLDTDLAIILGYFTLDALALFVLGIWILRRPLHGTVDILGRSAGKVILFLALGLSVVIFFFATCVATVATS